jgi:hypothetical protein
MSQYFDYFVCSQSLIEQWADALAQGDEERQVSLQADLPRFVGFKNLGNDEVNILAWCVKGENTDIAAAVGELDLIRAVSDLEGPWVMAFRQPAVAAIAGMVIDEPLLERWVRAVAEFHGRDEDICRRFLTPRDAGTLKDLCETAVKNSLGVFVCFYG